MLKDLESMPVEVEDSDEESKSEGDKFIEDLLASNINNVSILNHLPK